MSPLSRVYEIYKDRGGTELLKRLLYQIPYQISERIFGSKVWLLAQYHTNSMKYETVKDPYKIKHIDPTEVRYRSARARQSDRCRWKDIGRIQGGKWDFESKAPEYAIENVLLYQAIEDHFQIGVPWEETEYVEKSLDRLRQGDHKETWRNVVRTEDDLWERCMQLDELYNQITTDGYKSKREVFASQSNDPMGYYPRTFKYTIDEVMIDRARDGEPLLVDGHHRMYLAKVCGLEKIPVLEVVQHKGYVEAPQDT